MDKCQGVFGKIFGHSFRVAITKGAPDLKLRDYQGGRDALFISFCGSTQFAVVRGRALITSDGEAIEGDALNDVEVKGVVTYLINREGWHNEDDIPIM